MNNAHENLYDVIVIGGGPAGLTAALYLARAKYKVLVIEKEHFGGQITITSEVVNYPGIEKTSGEALTSSMYKQAESFGAEFLLADVQKIDTEGDIKTIHTSRGTKQCFGVLLATGAHPRMLGFKGEDEFKGRGVAYCATCDGEFFTGKEVFVIGGGFAAAEESVFLTKYAKKVTMLLVTDDFTCAKSTAEHAKNNEKIEVIYNTEVLEVSGDTSLNYIKYRNIITGEITEYRAKENDNFGVFVFAGYVPATALLKGKADTTDDGYIITDKNQQTTLSGIYAAGDVCVKPLRQVVTAVGDGALAATELEKYASQMHEKTGIVPVFKDVKPKEKTDKENVSDENSLFTSDMLAQLRTVFDKMNNEIVLQLNLDDTDVSIELKEYISQLCKLSDKISFEIVSFDDKTPSVRVCHKDKTWSGLAFYGVPGGHEFTSFILGLYNVSGPGQSLDDEVINKIKAIDKNIDIKVLVSLSCTKCPELVIASQRIASLNEKVTAKVYDLNHFEDIQKKYNVLSVPCLVINDDNVTFGKKNILQILELIDNIK